MASGIQRQYASRIEGMTSFKVVDFLEAAVKMEAQGRDIVRMEAGEPAFPTAPAIIEAASAALRDEKTFYTPSLGIIELREAIAGFYQTRYGLRIPAERVVVTTQPDAGWMYFLTHVSSCYSTLLVGDFYGNMAVTL